MQISDLYEKQIDRRINPAVVVSEMKDYFVSQEIEEYVFTEGITKNVYKFLNALANKTEGKTGVWISGYYGSGKSHFIKYLFYCLNKALPRKFFFFEVVYQFVINIEDLTLEIMVGALKFLIELVNFPPKLVFLLRVIRINISRKKQVPRIWIFKSVLGKQVEQGVEIYHRLYIFKFFIRPQ